MPFDMTEEELARFRAGDNDAFKKIFNDFFKPIWIYAYLRIKDEGEAQDIATETLWKLYERRANFYSLPAIKGFLYVTAMHAGLSYLGKKSKIEKEVFKFLLTHLPANVVIEDVLLQPEKDSLVKVVNNEIEKLPSRCKQIFKMHYLDKVSIKEIANRMGIAASTVYNQKVKARNLLRKALLKNKFFFENL